MILGTNRPPYEEPITSHDLLFFSILTVFWWIAIWGITETLLSHFIKNSLTYRLAVYFFLLAFVFYMILVRPKIMNYL